VLVEQLERSRALGFLGPGPVEPHIDHARRFAAALEGLGASVAARPVRALDLGSGGGLPGLVLVSAWPTTDWCLLDANQRRTEFLQDAVDELGLAERVAVRRGRAEELAHDPSLRCTFDLVVARSFGRPAVTAECAAGFLAVGGSLVVSEPPSVQREGDPADGPRWDPDGLAQLGLEDRGQHAGCQVLRAIEPCPERYPRRIGIPAKRPLFR
jgi:16S rRNA (guanine527-N7)-methyltransferase